MSLINNGNFNFNQEELKDLSGVIAELGFNNPEITNLHAVEQGKKWNEQIVFSDRLGLLGKPLTSCTPEEVAGLTFSEKTWTPKDFAFRLSHCTADSNKQDKLLRQMSRMNDDFYKIFEGSQNPIGNFLIAQVVQALPEDILIKAWFSDESADEIAEGGNFTNGTDLAFFNSFNGLFKQLFTEILPGTKNHVEITANAGSDYDAQVLAEGDAYAILRKMFNKADSRLRGLQDKKFYVTRSIYDGYLNDLEDKQVSGAGNTMITENGQTRLFCRGIEVVNIEIWDRTINEYQNDGTKLYLPHRAVLTTPDNVPIATLNNADFSVTKAWYENKDNTNYIDGAYTLDAKHLEDYKTVVAY